MGMDKEMVVPIKKTPLWASWAEMEKSRKRLRLTKGISHAAVMMAEGRTGRVGHKPRAGARLR